jgi:hypothetical protein
MPELLLKRSLCQIGNAYHAPQEVFRPTKERAEHWVKTFNHLKNKKYRIPVPWSHRLSALPDVDEVSDEEWLKANEKRAVEEALYNASFVRDLAIEKRPEGEFVTVTIPAPPGFTQFDKATGDLINPTTSSRIGEVSGAWAKSWTAGSGEKFSDVLCHVALCTLPVNADQRQSDTVSPNHTTLSTKRGSVEYSFMMSSRGAYMAVEQPKTIVTPPAVTTLATKKPKDDEMPPEDDDVYTPLDDEENQEDEDLDTDDETQIPAEPAVAAEDVTPAEAPTEPVAEEMPAPKPLGQPGVDKTKEIVRILGEMGLALPPMTDANTLEDYLYISLIALQNAGMRFEREEPDEAMNQPPAQATSGAEGQAPVPEAPPVMMSTHTAALSAKDGEIAALKKQIEDAKTNHPTAFTTLSSITDPRLQKLYKRDQSGMRKEARAICDRLKRMGVPVWKCNELAADAGMITLSVNAAGDIKMPTKLKVLRGILSAVEAMRGLRKEPTVKQPQDASQPTAPTTLSTATPTPRGKPVAEDGPLQAAQKHKDGKHGLPPAPVMDFLVATARSFACPTPSNN